MTMFHMANDSHFSTTSQPAGSASTDEAKMIHQFDHRFASLIGKLSAGYKVEAMERASRGESYVVTSGTGSGKSLNYFLPIIDAFLARPHRSKIVNSHQMKTLA